MKKDEDRFRLGPVLLTAFAALALLFLFRSVDLRFYGEDDRPVGDISDLEGISNRSDLNVLFVLIDTLRADRLGAYGYERATSPFLDELSSSGIRFARNLAQSSWTKASMASLWTGLYPLRAGVTKFDHALASEALLPAEVLSDAGYRTAGLYRNGWVSGYFGFDQGFRNYYKPAGKSISKSILQENPNITDRGADSDLTADAIEFLRIHGDERWFLYLHLMDLHEYVYDDESAVFGTGSSDIYDNSILRVDSILKRLYAGLADMRLLERTILVIASDHGEAFGERGFEGHARSLFSETTETPVILSLPFRLEPGLVIDSRTRNIDIWPTILELVGLPQIEGIDGRSRVPEILAAASGVDGPPEEGVSFAHLDEDWGRSSSQSHQAVSVTEGPYRFVRGTDFSGAAFETLLDRRDGEQADHLADEPEVAALLRKEAAQHLESAIKWSTQPPRLEIDEIQLNQLRALGYRIP
jgi:arylsulfatase A-like enzyme